MIPCTLSTTVSILWHSTLCESHIPGRASCTCYHDDTSLCCRRSGAGLASGHHTGDIYRTRPVAYHTTSTDMSWHTGHMIISDYIPTLVCRGIGWCAVWNHIIRRVALRVRASHISDNQTRCGVHHGHDGEAYHTRTRTHIVAITSPWQGKKKWHRLSFHRIHVLSMTHNEITLS